MPRYFFDITDSDGFHPDPVGDELESFEEAREQVQCILPDILRDEMPTGDENQTVSCCVRDERHGPVYRGYLTYRGTELIVKAALDHAGHRVGAAERAAAGRDQPA